MKDHIVNKKELRKRLEAKGWPFDNPNTSTLDEITGRIDDMNKNREQRRFIYTVVYYDNEIGDHNTANVTIPYIEPATVQNLMAEYHISEFISEDIVFKTTKPLSQDPFMERSLYVEKAKMKAIKDMLENGIDATPFDI